MSSENDLNEEADLDELKKAANAHFKGVMEKLGDRAKELKNDARENIRWAAMAYAKLVKAQAKGDIENDSLQESFDDVESIVSDWTWIGLADTMELAKEAFWDVASKLGGVVGTVLGTMATTALKALKAG